MATTARIGNRKTWIVNVGAYNGGTHDHSKLFNRDANDQHPMGAIKGLETFAENTKAHMASKENPHGVTAFQVGARPDTWMPTAAEVGARPDTWMPTAAQVGAAPAGYGLGEDFPREATDIESVAKSGFVRWYNNTITAIPYGWYYGMYIDYGTDDGLLLLKQYNSANMVLRHRGNDGWNAWEWVNPPMSTGIEYRTTERWNSKPVYTKLIDCGLSANGKTIAVGAFIVRYAGKLGDMSLPYIPGSLTSDYSAYFSVTDGQAILYCGTQVVNINAYLQIWYTK